MTKLRVPLQAPVRALSLHTEIPQLAVIENDGSVLSVFQTEGARLFQENALKAGGSFRPSYPAVFHDCVFSADGANLWVSAELSSGAIEVQRRTSTDWNVTERVTVEDPFGASSSMLFSTRSPDMFVLWLAAGQDGQCVYWIRRRANELVAEYEPIFVNTTPTEFSPDGCSLLVVDESGALRSHVFPNLALQWVLPAPGGEDDPFAESLSFLDASRALVATNEQRLYVIDVVSGKIVSEVFVDGHEPKPISTYYPRVNDDGTICTDLTHFRKIGDEIAFIRRSDGGVELRGWRDQLLCVPVSFFLPHGT